MAEVVVSALVEQLISTINEQIKTEIHLVRGVDKEVLNLSDDLKSLRNVLDDAESRRFQDKNINQWLSRLEQTSYEMEDVLDEWNYALLKLKMAAPPADPKHMVCSFIPSPCLCFKKVVVRHDIGTKIKNVKQQLDEILREKDRFNFVESVPITDRLPGSWRVQSTSMVDSTKVHGRDTDVDFLVSKLLDNGASQGIQILGIVGMGGLGKTTLAQLVYNHSRVEESFDLKIWICVSDPFDPAVIGKCILEKVKKETSSNTFQLDALLVLVKESIVGKKFLLVLDDVWTEDPNKWEPLEHSLGCGGAGSKILVTTRKDGVVKMMGSREGEICRPGVLSDEDCWLLFSRIALSERNEVEFEEIGKKIAKKCNGLPLAAKTLASLLCFKSSLDEWENVLNSEIWKLNEAAVDIFPHLLLSYNELSPVLKRCFSYCAVFPKDTEINVDSLIENWMALGYLGSDISDMKLRGREYFDVLAMRSLFQDFKISDLDKKIDSCKMHDIVHDFAQFVRKSGRVEGTRMNKTTCQVCDPSFVSNVNQFCSLVWSKKECPPSNLCDCVTRRLRVLSMNGCGLQSIPLRLENLIHLRWLDLCGNTLSQENLRIIFQLYFLQTLKLSQCKLETILKEIGNLIHLRDLDLSWNMSLKELPESICGLHELRSLDISGCWSLSRIPQGLAQLTGLGKLRGFRGGSGCNKLGLLNKLNHLSHLDLIIRLGDEEVVEDAREAELRKKIHLHELSIEFEDEMDDEIREGVWMDVIDALQPHLKLKHLVIKNYKGSKLALSSWIVSPLNQLRSTVLSGCSQLSSLPPLGKLPCLEQILIYRMEGLEIVGREWLGGSSSNTSHVIAAFPKLKILMFWECRKWKEWEDITAEEEEQHSTIMPCLEELTIKGCPVLTKLPRSLLSKSWPLDKLHIIGSEELQQHCTDNGVVFSDSLLG